MNITMNKHSEGDWIKYYNNNIIKDGKILKKRKDGFLVVGSYEQDPDPNIINPDKIAGDVNE